MMNKTLTLRRRGVLTLPAELRRRYRLEEGEPLTLIDLGGVFLLSPKVPLVPKLVGEIERVREEAGLGVEDLLEGLDEQRRRLYQERYGR
jgi:bifunctional DNA-binding transcriptional regulator/antitoxin component of YhaV-PrlF toxin-antitoxin module